jgi:hypothetical protein
MPGNREHGLAITLRVIQTIEQMNASRTGCRETYTQSPRIFGVATRGESCRFLMADLNELQPVLPGAKSFENSVDAIAWKAKNYSDVPGNQSLNQ